MALENSMIYTTIFKNYLDNCAELGWEEIKTTAYIKKQLKDQPFIDGFGKNKTGLLYKIGNGKKAILLRADIDALKTKKGIKHICGHSSHAAGLMQAFIELKKEEKTFTMKNKSIYFLFQPAEETYPSGAKEFLRRCRLLLPHIKYAFGVHVKPHLQLGAIGLYDGVVWARGDYMEIEIFGKTVHVKDAPLGVDALEIGAHILLYIKTLQKKYKSVIRISIGTLQGGLHPNILAGHAVLKGDVRMKDEKYQKIIKKLLQEKIVQLQKKYHAKIKLSYFDGYPVLKNNTFLSKKAVQEFKSKKWNVTQDSSLFSFGCEDFACISEKIPSVYAFIGAGGKKDIHQDDFSVSSKVAETIYRYFYTVGNWWLSSEAKYS